MSYTRSYIDGDFTIAKATGVPLLTQPFAGDKNYYVLTQEFVQFVENFTPTALNTVHPDAAYSTYKLVSESPEQDIGNGVVKWQRTYAAPPATRNDYATISYSFVGFYGTVTDIAIVSSFPVVGRNRFSNNVTCRIQYDYYLVDGTTYVTPLDIPVIQEQRYYIPKGTIAGAVFTPTYTRGTANDFAFGKPTDLIYDKADWGNLVPSYPSTTEYIGYITAGTEIVAEASQLSRWLGNYYVRSTKYIKPQ